MEENSGEGEKRRNRIEEGDGKLQKKRNFYFYGESRGERIKEAKKIGGVLPQERG